MVDNLPIADMSNDDRQHLIWLKNELSQITSNFDRYSELGNILRTELTRLDHWKAKGRGNPRKGFNRSTAAQQQAQFKQQLYQTVSSD